MREEPCLFVRHVPRQLRDDQIESLFANFGSCGVRILNAKQKKTVSAFVSFRSLAEAQCAVTRLHQMEVMGSRLSAELSNRGLPVYEPAGRCDSMKDKETKYLALLKQLHLDNCPPTGLKYLYPPPTLHVLLNILSALYEHKRLYTQVLHLMNKMNLPCPFNADFVRHSKISTLFSLSQKQWTCELMSQKLDEVDEEEFLKTASTFIPQENVTEEPVEPLPMQAASASDTEDEVESELEDEGASRDEAQSAVLNYLKRIRQRKSRGGIKRPRFIKPAAAVRSEDGVVKKRSEQVFETSLLSRKPIQMRVTSDLTSIRDEPTTERLESHGLPPIIPSLQTVPTKIPSEPKETSLSHPSQITRETDLKTSSNPETSSHIDQKDHELKSSSIETKIVDVFKKTEVCQKMRQESSESVEMKGTEDVASEELPVTKFSVISKEQLDSNRLGERDRGFVKAFNNYSAGAPSCRLYVKNLAKNVTQEDMEYIFRRYYLPDYKQQGTMFDIRLMQEGRMKGQAFITLQTESQARQALAETNGYILKDKPMVIQYARSIQAKLGN